jgi:hypothetical protein
MNFLDFQGGRIESERIEHLVQWLEVTLGAKLTAFAVGARDADELDRYAAGERPDADAERRLRNVYAVTWFFAAQDGPGAAHAWLLEPNPELGGRTPAQLLHEGQAPEAVWFAAAPIY